MLKPRTWKPRDGPLSAAHTEVFIAGERSSQGWLPDGRELYNPAELSEPLSEKMSRSQNCKVSQGDTRIWVLTQESQLDDISELRYLTPAATMESRYRTAKQVSESFPAQEKKKWVKESERAEAQWKLYSALIWFLMEAITGTCAWSLIPFKPGTTEETWMKKANSMTNGFHSDGK